MKMKLPEKEWLTIKELGKRWNISKSDIFHYLEIGILNTHIKLKQDTALFLLHHDDSGRITGQDYYHGIGMFMILNFDRVYWENIEFTYIADLQTSNVLIAREKKTFSFRQAFCIFHDDLLILMKDIKKFEEDHQDEPSTLDEISHEVLPRSENNIKLPTDSTGREMLPLRLIPFITNENIGPERLALVLAEKGDLSGYKALDAQGKLKAYRLLDGNLICMKRAEWDTPLYALQSLRECYEKLHKHYAEWRVEALKLLPPAFVWRDEFEKAHSHSMLPGDHEKKELNWCPYFPEEINTAFLMKVGTESPPAEHTVPEVSKRHKITDEERKTKSKSAIQLAVESFLDNTPGGNKAGFYTFLKNQIKLPKEVMLKNGESYAYFFKEVKEKGSQEGVYLNHPKEGKKEGDPAWNHYSGDDVSGIISKEKNNRKTQQPEK
jgi:hypothetical protein